MNTISGWINRILRADVSTIPDETMEEFRMLSGFKPKEISRLHKTFTNLVNNQEGLLSKEAFLDMDCIVNNPLKNRVAQAFGYDEECTAINFKKFLTGVASFNSPGQVENKIKIAFKIQDFDDDGVLNKADLIQYLKLITAENTLTDDELERVANNVLEESSSDEKSNHLTFSDFQRVVASQDLQAKLLIPI